ncbi:MAG: 4-hydroxy-tetrahydrodipicolinate reductase [Phycisphaerae bacterium]|nr:MAG: 4-hydroxy-tetrahydrodipicolinate reductase [Phycisphaerae bacterium]
MTRIAITGCAGRMGLRLVALGHEHSQTQISAAIERADSVHIGRDAGELAGVGQIGVKVTADLPSKPDVLIDFTAPVGTRNWLQICRELKIPMLIGTTGLTENDHRLIDQAAEDIPVLQAGNMSLGVTVMCKIVSEVARMLGQDYDVEIVEAHHRFKKDAPSGTAEMIAHSILQALQRPTTELRYGRHGTECTRTPKEVGMHSLRMGDEIGLHTAYFGGLGERLEITHKATNRDTFVHGALRAAVWLTHQKPGRYTIGNVLGI